MSHKIRQILVYIVIVVGLSWIAWSAWKILKSSDTGEIEASSITIPKTDANAVGAVRGREPGEQNIDFSDDFVGGRANPFTPYSGAIPTVEQSTSSENTDGTAAASDSSDTTTTETTETAVAPTGIPTDNPLAATSNEYPSGDEAPDINLDEL